MTVTLTRLKGAVLDLCPKAAGGVKVIVPNLTEKCGNRTSRGKKGKNSNSKPEPKSWKTKGIIVVDEFGLLGFLFGHAGVEAAMDHKAETLTSIPLLCC